MTSLLDLVRERKAALERKQRALFGDLADNMLADGVAILLERVRLEPAVHTERIRACLRPAWRGPLVFPAGEGPGARVSASAAPTLETPGKASAFAGSEVCSVNISRPYPDAADWSVHDPGCVKTHVLVKSEKYNSPARYRTIMCAA
jgi:hypothetical protein